MVAGGFILATLITVRAGNSGLAMLGPLFLSLTLLGASASQSRLRGSSPTPSWAAVIVAISVVVSSLIVGYRDPVLIKTLMPSLGAAGWIAVLARSQERRKPCRAVSSLS
jgi:peptidoglycan/LPS O-acetylase OafA/YrhL